MPIQTTTRGLRVSVSGVFCLLCPRNLQVPSRWWGSALFAEQCLRQPGSFDFNETVSGGGEDKGQCRRLGLLAKKGDCTALGQSRCERDGGGPSG